YHGYPKAAPYDAIIVTAAPPHVPDKLIEQLAPEGRMVIPVGSSYQILYLITKNEEGVVTEDPVFSVVFVPMVR
nr:protein-L-isoaspartate O-methyltransferase [Parabacteroides sp.]